MTLLAAIATGDASAAATWGVVDATSYLNSENVTESLLTTAYSGTRSSAFTPGAITVSHLLVKLCERIGTTGTISVSLRNSTLGLDDFVTGTEVTINTADLPAALEADLNGGWIAFKLTSPVLLLAATNYNIQAKTSSASMVDLWCDGTVDNLARCLVTTTTQAPVAGDDMIICREWTAASTNTAFTVTWNITASTDFGSTPTAANSLITPGIAVCDGGTLSSGTTAATAYVMKLSNSLIVYAGGTLNFGTSGTPVPSGSSFTLTFDCGANVDYGLVVRNLGTWNGYGTKEFTSSPSNHYTLLTADEAAAQTVIGAVQDTTGFQIGDELVFAPTTRTNTEAESKLISTVDSATAFTLTAGLTNAHSGTNDANGDIRCEIGNLTRNVGIRGVSATLQAYIDIKATAVVTLRKCEFKWLGSATANKRGIDVATTTGTFDMQFCSLHDFVVTSSRGINLSPTTGSGVTFSNNVAYNINDAHLVNVATTGVLTLHNNMFCRNVVGTAMVVLADAGSIFTDNRVAGSSSAGLSLGEIGGTIGTFSGNVTHSNNASGALFTNSINGTVSSLRSWRNTTSNASTGNVNVDVASQTKTGPLIFDSLITFGGSNRSLCVSCGNVRLISPLIYAGTTLASSIGIYIGGTSNSTVGQSMFLEIENGLIGTISTHSTADILVGSTTVGCRAVLHNTTLNSSTEVSTPADLGYGAFICSLKHDTVVGSHKTWKGAGRSSGASLEIDTVIFNTASPSLRMYPGSATVRLESSTWEVAVASGATLTPSILVRYSKVGDAGGIAYVPTTAPRLIVKRNVAAGIAADTVIATHGGGADWVTLSGTTVAVTDDAILEFYVDCDGTVGWINVDDFACVAPNPNGMKYWSPQHAGPLALGLPAGGGGLQLARGMHGGMRS